jgi:predicted regulator of Ras-like GTPase activity (Roadblock/LC7/MglB family)
MVLNKVLDNVLDIPGVDGICLFGLDGDVYLNRMPPFLTPDVFADALRRISALYETMDENFLPCDDYLLRFSEKWILFRRIDQTVLLVLAAEKANFASTRMVTNMALKHLTPAAIAEFSSAPVAPDHPAPVSRAPVGSAPAAFSAHPFAQTTPVASAPAPAPEPESAPAPAAAEPAKGVRMFRGRAY